MSDSEALTSIASPSCRQPVFGARIQDLDVIQCLLGNAPLPWEMDAGFFEMIPNKDARNLVRNMLRCGFSPHVAFSKLRRCNEESRLRVKIHSCGSVATTLINLPVRPGTLEQKTLILHLCVVLVLFFSYGLLTVK